MRVCVDVAFALTGWLLGGVLGAGTIVCAFLVGPTAQLCFPLSRRLCARGLKFVKNSGRGIIRASPKTSLEVKALKIESVFDSAFAPYGKVLPGYDTAELLAALEKYTPLPEATDYVPSQPELEALPIAAQLAANAYGGDAHTARLVQRPQHQAQLSRIPPRQRDKLRHRGLHPPRRREL